MAKQTFTTGQVLTAAQMTDLQQTAMTGGAASTKTVSYVLVAADAGTRIAMNAAGSTTITVNTALFSAGDTVSIQNIGAGVCTVTAGTATVNTSGSLVLAQYQGGILYFTSASAAIFFQFATPASGDIEGVTAGVGISGGGTSGTVTITNDMATTITASGDIVVGTGNGTYDNLPIGTTGQVLTADTTVSPYKVKWAAAASGGGFTLLETITIPSSTTTITSASISNSYKHLCFVFSNIFTTSGNNLDCTLRFNSDSGSNYLYAGVSGQDSSAGGTNSGGAATSIGSGSMGGDSNYNLNGVLWVYRYTDTTRRTWTYQQMGGISTGGNSRYSILTGGYKGSSAISTLTMARVQTDATFQGTIYVYGVA